MVDTQHFCLRWNNYQSSITSAFENLRDDEDFVDVTLACDGKSLKAHRVVLSACSPYFRELLKSTPCKHPVIVLQDVAWTDLHALVEFIYHGEVNVHQRSLSSFLKTAEVLRVSGLTQQHADDREMAQVQSLIRSTQQQQQAAQQAQQQQAQQQQHHSQPPTPNHLHLHPAVSFADKLVEDALFTSPSSPPHGATVNQLLRRAALHHRRERRISCDPPDTATVDQLKRARHQQDHIMTSIANNNNSIPPQTQPEDFSPSGMKNNALNLNLNSAFSNKQNDVEGNGISSTEREHSPCSQSPTQITRCGNNDEVKSEPMDLLCSRDGITMGGQDDNSNDSGDTTAGHDNGPTSSLPQGPHSGSSGGATSAGPLGDHDDHDSHIGPYLTPSESKLFSTAAGSFNFSMAALAADPAALGGLNQSLQANADSLAGTSQGEVTLEERLASGRACTICGKVLRNKITLRRHVRDLHYAQTEEFWCTICNRCYRTKNSLVVHTCNYHQKKKVRKNIIVG